MSEKRFSKRAAVNHGFKMTQKYFVVILVIYLIFALYELLGFLLDRSAGEQNFLEEEIQALYSDPAAADDFYHFLYEAGYIDAKDRVTSKLVNLLNPNELDLPPHFEGDRERIFHFLEPYRYHLPFPKSVYYLLCFLLWIFDMLLQLGVVLISLKLARDQKPEIAELFSQGHLLLNYILATIVCILAVFAGFLLLIIPGIYISIMFGLYGYLIVDQNRGPIESLKMSKALTKGARGQLFVFGLILGLINLAGLLCLVIGLLATIPASYIAAAYVYDQLRKQSEIPAVVK